MNFVTSIQIYIKLRITHWAFKQTISQQITNEVIRFQTAKNYQSHRTTQSQTYPEPRFLTQPNGFSSKLFQCIQWTFTEQQTTCTEPLAHNREKQHSTCHHWEVRPVVEQTVLGQLLSLVWLCNPTDCSTPSFPILHYLPEFAQTLNTKWWEDRQSILPECSVRQRAHVLRYKSREMVSWKVKARSRLHGLSLANHQWYLLHTGCQ